MVVLAWSVHNPSFNTAVKSKNRTVLILFSRDDLVKQLVVLRSVGQPMSPRTFVIWFWDIDNRIVVIHIIIILYDYARCDIIIYTHHIALYIIIIIYAFITHTKSIKEESKINFSGLFLNIIFWFFSIRISLFVLLFDNGDDDNNEPRRRLTTTTSVTNSGYSFSVQTFRRPVFIFVAFLFSKRIASAEKCRWDRRRCARYAVNRFWPKTNCLTI